MLNFGILIVEDNSSFALELEMLVIDAGYEMLGIASDSNQAISLIAEKKPDLVLMDIDIPGDQDGIEIAQKLKLQNIPVIFCTAQTDKSSFERAKSVLPHAYLVKPFDMLSLQASIEITVRSLANNGQSESKDRSWIEDAILNDNFLIKHRGILRKVHCRDIEYVESDWNYCEIYSQEQKYTIKMSQKKIATMLGDLFVPIHKSYLVQLLKIDGIDTVNNKVLLGKKVLPLGRTFKADVLKRFKMLK